MGLSNETAWGLMRFLGEAEHSRGALPRVACLQNAYSLTCRLFEARVWRVLCASLQPARILLPLSGAVLTC